MATRADRAVARVENTCLPRLRGDLRGKVGLVKRRPDTRADLGDQVRGFDAELIAQYVDSAPHDILARACPPGMNEADGAAFAVGKIDRGAVRHVNAERQAADTRDKCIRTGVIGRFLGHGDNIAMHLFGCGNLRDVETALPQIFTMGRSKPLKRGRTIGDHIDAGDTRNKSRVYSGNTGKRLEYRRRVQRLFTVAFLSEGRGAGFCFFEGRNVSFFLGMAPLRTPGFGLSVELSRSLRLRSRAVSIGSS